jgi:two-component system, chemotaxis family, chemotaxis protein CheY
MGKTIMIIDDSISLRQVVSMTLTSAGFDVLEASDGRDALAKLTGQKVHLMVCDVNMPNLDGIGFLRAVRLLPTYRFTPIIMLTTEAGEDKKREGQMAGAKAWLVKPFKPALLLQAVSKLVLP